MPCQRRDPQRSMMMMARDYLKKVMGICSMKRALSFATDWTMLTHWVWIKLILDWGKMWPRICFLVLWVKYARVIRDFFLFSIFNWSIFCCEICVALINLFWNIILNRIANWTSLDLGMDIRSACVFYTTLYQDRMVPPIMLAIDCKVVNWIWKCCPIFFKHVSLWCLFLDPLLTTHHSNIGAGMRLRT
jgi:hypothetical protein